MKTYLLKSVQRLKRYSQELDAKAILFSKSWEVFNESGDKELLIFKPNTDLLIVRNGIVEKGRWELIDVANIIIYAGDNKGYMFNAAYIEDEFLALRLDGTKEYMVMIEADMKNRFSLNSIQSIEGYLDNRYKRIEAKKEAESEEQKRNEEEKRRKQAEKEYRIREEELRRIREANDPKRIKAEREKNIKLYNKNKKRYNNVVLIRISVVLILILLLVKINGSASNNNETDLTTYTVLFFLVLIISIIVDAKSDYFFEAKKDYLKYKKLVENQDR